MVAGRRTAQEKHRHLTRFSSLYAPAFLAGVMLIYQLPALPGLPLWLLGCCVMLVIFRWRADIGVIAAAAFLGALYFAFHAHQMLQAQWPEQRHGEDLWLSGFVQNIPQRMGRDWRFLIQSDEFPGVLRVSWYRSTETLRAGQCWRLKLRMRTPRGTVNPSGFDYEGWLFRQGITATAYVREAQPCADRQHSQAAILRWREKAIHRLQGHLAGHDQAPVILALGLGFRQAFTDRDWEVLRNTGTSHLMAISGLHIGIVALWAYGLGSWLWRRNASLLNICSSTRAGIVTSAGGAFFYAVISGFELPAQRALVMLLVFYLALWIGRRVAMTQVLGIALLAVLLLDPFAVARAGFWLSFGAVACIAYLLSHRWQNPGAMRSLLVLQLGLGLMLMPLTLFWFGAVSWLAPVVNLFLVPVFSLLVPLLLLVIVGNLFSLPFAQTVLHWLADGIGVIWQGLYWIDESVTPVASYEFSAGIWACLMLLGALWLVAPSGWPARYLGACCLIPLLSFVSVANQAPRMTVLDVGQGLAVVFESEGKVLVYDAGPAYSGGFDAGEMIVLPYLKSRGYRQIDVLVQSHADLDHRGGMSALMSSLPVLTHYGVEADAPCRAGMNWAWHGASFIFLHPDERQWTRNNGSCVLKIKAGTREILLVGDIEQKAERHLIKKYAGDLSADILVAPHHGSASSSSIAFLKAVHPDISVFSAGWKNRWGFPAENVVKRHRVIGARIFSTAEQGAIVLELPAGEETIYPVTWREHDRRIWRR